MGTNTFETNADHRSRLAANAGTGSPAGIRTRPAWTLASLALLTLALSACAVYVPGPGYGNWGHGYHEDHGWHRY